MNVKETKALCQVVRGIAPAQFFDDETPALWAGILRDVQPADAREAVRLLAEDHRFIAPADIVDKVRQIRDERLRTAGFDTITPNVDPDDPVAYQAELVAIRTAIADDAFDVPMYLAGGFTLTGAGPLRALGEPEEGRKLQLDAAIDRLAGKLTAPRLPAGASRA